MQNDRFEAKCRVCERKLQMTFKRNASANSLVLKPDECPNHHGQSIIICPERTDIRVQEPT